MLADTICKVYLSRKHNNNSRLQGGSSLQGLIHLRVYCMILSTTLDPRKQLARIDLHTVYGSYTSSQELFWEQACFEI